MSVGSILGGGVHLIRSQPRVVAIWAVLYTIVAALGLAAIRPSMAAMMAAQRQTAANAAMGIRTPPVFPAGTFGSFFLVELVFAAFAVVGFAAVVRAVVRPMGDRFAYLRVGMDELRLIGLGVLLVLLLLVAEIVAILVIILLVTVSALAIGKTGGTIIGVILGIALFCALIYAQVRLSLAGALTVIEGRIVIKDAWRATNGHFWTLFGVFLLLAVAYFIIGIVSIAITDSQLLIAYASMNGQAIQAAAQAQYAAQTAGFSLGYILRLVLGAIVAIPMAVIGVGAIATAALEMGGVPNTIATEFE